MEKSKLNYFSLIALFVLTFYCKKNETDSFTGVANNWWSGLEVDWTFGGGNQIVILGFNLEQVIGATSAIWVLQQMLLLKIQMLNVIIAIYYFVLNNN